MQFCTDLQQFRVGSTDFFPFQHATALVRIQEQLQNCSLRKNLADMFVDTAGVLNQDYREMMKKENKSIGAIRYQISENKGKLSAAKQRAREAGIFIREDANFRFVAPVGPSGADSGVGSSCGSVGSSVSGQFGESSSGPSSGFSATSMAPPPPKSFLVENLSVSDAAAVATTSSSGALPDLFDAIGPAAALSAHQVLPTTGGASEVPLMVSEPSVSMASLNTPVFEHADLFSPATVTEEEKSE